MLKTLDAGKDRMPFKTDSRQFSVPVVTLKRRVKGKNKHAVNAAKTCLSQRIWSQQCIFRRRNSDITLCILESTSAARTGAFKKSVVDNFFLF